MTDFCFTFGSAVILFRLFMILWMLFLNVKFLVKAKKLYVETNNKPQGDYVLHKGEYAL